MKETKLKSVLLLIGATVLGAFGQFFFKLAFTDKLLGPTLLVGLGAYAISTAIYFYVLSRVNLSWAYGLNGITYVVTVVLAATILAEHVSLFRWAGVLVIVAGVAIVSMS
jgi:drug/metabolite transporter (DMT)-like permease